MSNPTIEQRFAQIAALFAADVPPLNTKREIYELIEVTIQHFAGNLGYWEKLHIGSAINNLASNLAIGNPKSMSWLRLCVTTLAFAFVPKGVRNDSIPPRDPEIERITAEELHKALQSLQSRL